MDSRGPAPDDGDAADERREPAGAALDLVDGVAFAAIFALALALRLVYLTDVWSIPFFENPVVDARSYDDWAWRIAQGDWWGDRAFYQAPAYPYFLASIYALAGHDLWAAHVVQMVLGALSCGFAYLAARLFFDRQSGVAAGLLLAAYAPAIFFDGLTQKAGLGLFLTTLTMFLLARFTRRPSAPAAAASGAGLALLCLTRENALAFAPVIALWMGLGLRLRWRLPGPADIGLAQRMRWMTAFAGTLLALLGLVGVRNYVVDDTFALTTAQMGPNFYIGNNPNATGMYAPLLPGRHTPDFEGSDARKLAEAALRRPLTPGEVSDYWMGRAFAFIGEQPTDWLDLLVAKTLLTVNEFEVPDSEDIYPYAESSPLLRGLLHVLHFGVFAPLAVAGMVLAWRRRRDVELLYGLTAVFAASVVAFYVFARYRFPLVPLALPFAGHALVRGAQLVRERRLRELVVPTIAAAVVAIVSNIDIVDEEPFQLAAYTNLGNIMLADGKPDEAEPFLLRALELNPDSADLQLHLGVMRSQQGELVAAEKHFLRMLEIEKDDYRPHLALARLYAKQGRREAALRHRRTALRLNPDLNLPREARRGRALPGEAGDGSSPGASK